jgi:hypothetical protein
MEIARAERQLQRAQQKYEAAIHQVDKDNDVMMRDVILPPTPMEGVEYSVPIHIVITT